ncbi:hypothetical protein GP486_000829 [Trichoglossum hirsutum]|uniref:Arginine N-methyltransferase 2 n=1 Tax=Trichoglossum hirsutum TaxID=265104 RepID=A0A9P8LI06_9PEZI|nr:hypothetical protein GP486_000829 [Trichoglossum hirsutum]
MTDEVDSDVQVQMILLAAAHHNLEDLRALLRRGSASAQDPETRYTPLHAAIAACAPEDEHQDGRLEEEQTTSEDLEAAVKTVKLLLQNGAIWNDLDNNNETPGCLAYRLGLKELYELMVDAGVRAELLLTHLDEYQRLEQSAEEDGDDDDDDDDDKGMTGTKEPDAPGADLGATEPTNAEVNSEDYLRSELTFRGDRLLDADANGVMMAWEADIMKRTADLLLPGPGLRVLNIGFGLGVIDACFQSHSPRSHHIVEAHPAVLARLRQDGWCEKPGVVVHEGRWQDVLPKLLQENLMFDAIYFDTFAEDYRSLKEFFGEYAIGLLDPQGGEDGRGGRWGFFNGLGADRRICYDVYIKVVELDLFEAGFDTEWEEVTVPDLVRSGEWEGVRRKYWVLDKYKLPICRFMD